ncbi:MAG TPA: glutathione S-transferase family protein [Xanthobacteraceae bacterium]|jgi:glutathione S-transferase|nr:glutathione S-transferase family protein [Xanthobacteraceae bacterium]
MTLKLYFHPLSSYCQKALIALYETGAPFEPIMIDLFDEASAATLRRLWPMTRFPVLRDEARNLTIPESSIIVEYLARHHPGASRLVPDDPELAREVRLHDRFFDFYVNDQVTKIVTDRLRPPGQNDVFGVGEARRKLTTALDMLEQDMAERTWSVGESFSMADCAAAAPLNYANMVMPFSDTRRSVARYLDRLRQRPSFARVLAEAEPYLKLMPK